MSFTSLSVLKRHLDIESNDLTQDARLEQMRQQSEQAVLTYLNRNSLERVTYTEYYDGNGLTKLVLRNIPVVSITSIYEDRNGGYYGDAVSAFPTSSLLTAGVDYVLQRDGKSPEVGKSGMVIRIGSVWPALSERIYGLLAGDSVNGIGNVKITYIAGYASVPSDISLAVYQFIGELLGTAKTGGALQRERLDYYSYDRGTIDMSTFGMSGAAKLLAPYRDVVIGIA